MGGDLLHDDLLARRCCKRAGPVTLVDLDSFHGRAEEGGEAGRDALPEMFARGVDQKQAASEVGFELLGALHECGQDGAERHIGSEELKRPAPELLKPLGPLGVGDVDEGADHAAECPIGLTEGLALVEGAAWLSVSIGDGDFLDRFTPFGNQLQVCRLERFADRFRHKLKFKHGLADEALPPHTEGPLERGVSADEHRVLILHKNGVGHRVEQCRLERVLLFHLALA